MAFINNLKERIKKFQQQQPQTELKPQPTTIKTTPTTTFKIGESLIPEQGYTQSTAPVKTNIKAPLTTIKPQTLPQKTSPQLFQNKIITTPLGEFSKTTTPVLEKEIHPSEIPKELWEKYYQASSKIGTGLAKSALSTFFGLGNLFLNLFPEDAKQKGKEVYSQLQSKLAPVGGYEKIGSIIGDIAQTAITSNLLKEALVSVPSFVNFAKQFPKISEAITLGTIGTAIGQIKVPSDYTWKNRLKQAIIDFPEWAAWSLVGGIPKKEIWKYFPAYFSIGYLSSLIEGKSHKDALINGLGNAAISSIFKLAEVPKNIIDIEKQRAQQVLDKYGIKTHDDYIRAVRQYHPELYGSETYGTNDYSHLTRINSAWNLATKDLKQIEKSIMQEFSELWRELTQKPISTERALTIANNIPIGLTIKNVGGKPKEGKEGKLEVKPETKITPQILQQKAREALKQEVQPTTQPEIPPITPPTPPPTPPTEPPQTPGSPSLESLPPNDPVRKLVSFYNEMEKAREKTEKLYSKERSKRAAKIAEAGQRLSGEEAFIAQLAAAKGELPKANIAQLRQYFSQQDVDELFNRIEASDLMPYQKIRAKHELAKAFRGVTPTKSGLELLQRVFPKEFVETLKVPKHTSLIGEVVNLPRALMASTDFSASLRQGIFMIGRPKEFLPAFINQFKYAASEDAYQGLMENIVRDPFYPLAEKLKLALTDIDSNILTREERYVASNLAEKIPGIGRVIRASNRAYTGFLNKLRWDIFKDTYNQFKGLGYSDKELEEIIMPQMVRVINAGTGRGALPGELAKAGPILSGIAFSPRLVSSRLTLLNPAFYIKLPPPVRKWALETLLRSTAIIGTLMLLFKANGWKVGNNLLSADFGKVKKGNTRLDLTGGFGSYIRLGAQLLSGKIISSTTGKEIRVGEGYKPLTRLQILGRFAESKESPLLSFVTDLMRGENVVGEKITLPRAVVERFIQMVLSDLYDLLKTQNLSSTEKVIAGTLGVFGAGLQTYGETELVQGVNPLGQPTIEVQPKTGLAEDISTFLFGQQPLRKSQTSDVQSFYNQLKQLPPDQANQIFNQIKKQNPRLAQQIMEQRKNEILGITPDDLSVKALPIEDGSRAREILNRLNKLPTNEEKDKLWRDYERKGIITPTVARQLYILLGIKK